MYTQESAQEAAEAPPETESAVERPAMWIGTADDYQGPRQHGGWVEAARPIREVMTEIRDVIERTPDGLGQRWDIHELRGFGVWLRTPDDGLDTVLEVARGIGLYGVAFSGLVARLGVNSQAASLDRFRQAFVGEWPSEEAFIEQLITDSGWYEHLRGLPTELRAHIRFDTRKLLREVKRDLTIVGHADGIWVYDPRWW
jgi:hypothetical protein